MTASVQESTPISNEDIDNVLDKLGKQPALIETLLSSAQGGNVDDLEFLLALGERGVTLSFDADGGQIHRAQE